MPVIIPFFRTIFHGESSAYPESGAVFNTETQLYEYYGYSPNPTGTDLALFAKTDGYFYVRLANGSEYPLTPGGSSGTFLSKTGDAMNHHTDLGIPADASLTLMKSATGTYPYPNSSAAFMLAYASGSNAIAGNLFSSQNGHFTYFYNWTALRDSIRFYDEGSIMIAPYSTLYLGNLTLPLATGTSDIGSITGSFHAGYFDNLYLNGSPLAASTLYNSTPADVASAGVVGVSSSSSRGDHAHKGVHSFSATGSAQLFGDILLQGASGTVVSQSGNTIFIAGGSSSGGGTPSGPAGGDLTGTYPNPTVIKLQGFPVSPATPTTDDVLGWNGSQWIPTPENVGHEHGLDRWSASSGTTTLVLSSYASQIEGVYISGLQEDPLNYTMGASGSSIIFSTPLPHAFIVTANYILAQV